MAQMHSHSLCKTALFLYPVVGFKTTCVEIFSIKSCLLLNHVAHAYFHINFLETTTPNKKSLSSICITWRDIK